ncbi:MAG: hypothetical protein ACRYHQ_30615 [Janthinobacterium lividum]
MLVDAEKTDVRRFCGYPAYGAGAAGNMGWRFYQAYGAMEYRLNNLSPSEESVLRHHLSNLRAFEAAIPNAASNLDTAAAAVWTRNPSELHDRQRLEQDWGRRLCSFLGLPPGPGLINRQSLALVI